MPLLCSSIPPSTIPRNLKPLLTYNAPRSFYKLSKTHHPDRNPSDPSASQRFVKISEAYTTLSSPTKRQSYDRANPHLHASSSSHPPHRGSYFSSSSSSAYGYGPAGGRAPSGLSKRRSQFRGPPPSFYRSGGWGEHSAKRGAAHESSTGTSASPGGSYSSSSPGTGHPSTAGGMGPGQRPFGEHAAQNDVPHFDRERHFRTHETQEARRRVRQRAEALRRKGAGVEGAGEGDEGWIGGGSGGSYLVNFLFVSGIIGIGVFVPSFLYEVAFRGSGGGGL
jgi:curved DNA-binding protein CbpA